MTTVINTSTSFHLRVSKSPIGKKQHIHERKSHETKIQGVRQTSTQALELSGKMYAFLDPPRRKATEYSWTKTILRQGGRRKLFNPDLMNKLIRMEWTGLNNVCACARYYSSRRSRCNLVPRAHVSFGQRQDTELWNNQLY